MTKDGKVSFTYVYIGFCHAAACLKQYWCHLILTYPVSNNPISTVHGIGNADDEMANVITAYAQK